MELHKSITSKNWIVWLNMWQQYDIIISNSFNLNYIFFKLLIFNKLRDKFIFIFSQIQNRNIIRLIYCTHWGYISPVTVFPVFL